MAHPHVADGEDHLLVWRKAATILNKQSWTADKLYSKQDWAWGIKTHRKTASIVVTLNVTMRFEVLGLCEQSNDSPVRDSADSLLGLCEHSNDSPVRYSADSLLGLCEQGNDSPVRDSADSLVPSSAD